MLAIFEEALGSTINEAADLFSEVGWNRETIRPYVCLDKHRGFFVILIFS